MLVWLVTALAFGGDRREAVLDLLAAFREPVAKADLLALGEGVDAELMAIADDPTVPGTRRGNALVALQWYPADAVRQFLVRHLEPGEKPGEDALRRKAAHALSAFGAAAVPDLAKALADADAELRIATARALGLIPDPSARAAVAARREVETDGKVRAALDAVLAAAAPPAP